METKTTLAYNLEILRMLKEYLEIYPDVRFSQALNNLGIVKSKEGIGGGIYIEDTFYEESKDTLTRIKAING